MYDVKELGSDNGVGRGHPLDLVGGGEVHHGGVFSWSDGHHGLLGDQEGFVGVVGRVGQVWGLGR